MLKFKRSVWVHAVATVLVSVLFAAGCAAAPTGDGEPGFFELLGDVFSAQPLDEAALTDSLLTAVQGREDGFSVMVKPKDDVAGCAEKAASALSEDYYAFSSGFDKLELTKTDYLLAAKYDIAITYKEPTDGLRIISSPDEYAGLLQEAYAGHTSPVKFAVPSSDGLEEELEGAANSFRVENDAGYYVEGIAQDIEAVYEDYTIVQPTMSYRNDGRPDIDTIATVSSTWELIELMMKISPNENATLYFKRPNKKSKANFVEYQDGVFWAAENDGANHAFYYDLQFETYYRNNEYSFWRTCRNGELADVSPDYTEKVRAAISEIVAEVKDKGELTDKEKYTAIARAIAKRVEYDYDILEIRGKEPEAYDVLPNEYCASSDLYNGLVYGKTVCAGYAQIFQAICNEFDLPSWYVTGPADIKDLNSAHAWNAVLVDGELYYIDVTWADAGRSLDNTWMFLTYEQCMGQGRVLRPEAAPPWYTEALAKEKNAQ